MVKFDRALKAKNKRIKNVIEGLKVEKEAFLARTEVDERSIEQKIQEYLASKATPRVEQSRANERLPALQDKLASKVSMVVRLREEYSGLEAGE